MYVCTHEVLYQSIVDVFDRIIKGINDLIFGANFNSTNSTSIRYNARKISLEDLDTYSMVEFVIGRG